MASVLPNDSERVAWLVEHALVPKCLAHAVARGLQADDRGPCSRHEQGGWRREGAAHSDGGESHNASRYWSGGHEKSHRVNGGSVDKKLTAIIATAGLSDR